MKHKILFSEAGAVSIPNQHTLNSHDQTFLSDAHIPGGIIWENKLNCMGHLCTLNSPELLQKWVTVQSRRSPTMIFMVEMAVTKRLLWDCPHSCISHGLGRGHIYMARLGFSTFPVSHPGSVLAPRGSQSTTSHPGQCCSTGCLIATSYLTNILVIWGEKDFSLWLIGEACLEF